MFSTVYLVNKDYHKDYQRDIDDAFEQSTVDAVVDVGDQTLDAVVARRRNEVGHGQTLRLVDGLRRQPHSAVRPRHTSRHFDSVITS